MFSILTYGLSVALVGMGTVFCGLVILIGVIKGMEKVLPKITAGDFKLSNLKNVAAPKADAPTIVIQTANVNDDAIVAAISAALMTVIEEEVKENPAKAKSTFVVRSIRRVGTPAWNRAGREEQVYSRL
ncbi:MAG: OadG family protein [Clostridia bacterium]|nr:OadG family protein [Clostridia bacterium]MBQ2948939.1 OadG family protein [Clostridia bacterium]